MHQHVILQFIYFKPVHSTWPFIAWIWLQQFGILSAQVFLFYKDISYYCLDEFELYSDDDELSSKSNIGEKKTEREIAYSNYIYDIIIQRKIEIKWILIFNLKEFLCVNFDRMNAKWNLQQNTKYIDCRLEIPKKKINHTISPAESNNSQFSTT